MNKKGAVSGGVLIIVAIGLVLLWTQTTVLQDILEIGKEDIEVPGKCPSSGLTQVTINTQEALASTATDSEHSYYAFDKDGVLVANGDAGADGQSVFDLACGINKKYDVLLINDSATLGFYAIEVEIDASGPTTEVNKKTYEYGQVDISNIGSDADPAGNANVSSGIGKTCGFTVTYTVNESASAYNKPLIMCQANTNGTLDITMTGATEVPSKRPSRITALEVQNEWWIFEVDKMILSTDAAQKISGKIQFSESEVPVSISNLTCQISDQARYIKAEYQTLDMDEGFVLGAQSDANADIGGGDSDLVALHFNHASGYC